MLRVVVEFGQVTGRLGDETLEIVPRPLNGVLDQVRSVFQGATLGSFLRWVPNVVIADGMLGQDSSKFHSFEKRSYLLHFSVFLLISAELQLKPEHPLTQYDPSEFIQSS